MSSRALPAVVAAGSALALAASIAMGMSSGATWAGSTVANAAPATAPAPAPAASATPTATIGNAGYAGNGYGAGNRDGVAAGYGATFGFGANAGSPGGAATHDEEHLTATTPSGTLTAAQASNLQGMAEEEKLALDLYTAFAKQHNSRVFSNIAASEANHLASVRSLLKLYGLTDPTAGLGAGAFDSDRVQALYTDLLAKGRVSLAAAYDVGEAVEIDDLARLDEADESVTATDVLQVYRSLTTASERHLAIFRSH